VGVEDGRGVGVKVSVGAIVAVGGSGVKLGVYVGIWVRLAVGVRVPNLSWMITLGVTVGTFGTHNKLPAVMKGLVRQLAC
jgi:hypothetical protein